MTDTEDQLHLLKKHCSIILESGNALIDIEFERLKYRSSEYVRVPTSEGSKEVNRKKNRYKDILPFDHSRVVLPKERFVDGSDYINANIITDEKSKVCYIASQGPLPSTVDDFWRMIWHYNVTLIIMVCKEVEKGKPRCQRYWPYSEEVIQQKHMKISLAGEKKYTQSLKMRQIKVTKGNKERLVTQLHYMDWPDHGAPETTEAAMQLIEILHETYPKHDQPILVHCSAGCGRTGAIIAIDRITKLIQDRAKQINVYDVVLDLRRQRPAMVQTKEQYEFVYKVVQQMVESEIERHDADGVSHK
ncbi:tyrosine-protein phosphatase non-receptor type 12-like [Hydractinia symbiolongicarpus]|uniref:tyrosine-protein phosphatase non-receptor type 12-like n=1 Tax=Hydractinia symbiolongicarpus TaxID=13093 RepID=UPI00254DC6E0|nr:tyrosine-protein phosphatase non-receptor type 12-like [Hydractinia symbiolongicarpus]